MCQTVVSSHEDVMSWKRLHQYWLLVRWILRRWVIITKCLIITVRCWCFLYCKLEQVVEEIFDAMISDGITFTWHHCKNDKISLRSISLRWGIPVSGPSLMVADVLVPTRLQVTNNRSSETTDYANLYQSCYEAHILQWRHNGRDGVSDHQPHDCLLNRLFRRRSTKTSQLRVTGLRTNGQ